MDPILKFQDELNRRTFLKMTGGMGVAALFSLMGGNAFAAQGGQNRSDGIEACFPGHFPLFSLVFSRSHAAREFGTRLVAKVDKDAPKVAVVFFKAVVERPNVGLIEKAQHPLLELTAALTGNNLNQGNPLVNRLLDNPVKLRLDPVIAVVDVVQIQF